MAKTKLMVSYAHDDGTAEVNRLKELLEKARQEVWVDTAALIAGQEWAAEIENTIKKYDAVLLVLTATAAKSKYVQQEIEYANSIQKRVIPFHVAGVDVPAWVNASHYVSGTRVDDADVFAGLVAASDAVWGDVSAELTSLSLNVHATMAPLLNQLQDYCAIRPVSPEVVRVGAEFVRRMSDDLNAGRDLVQIVARIRADSYVDVTWTMERALRAHAPQVTTFMNEFMDKLKLPPVLVMPIVLVVMTAAEAAELAGGGAFSAESEPLREYFTRTIREQVEHTHGINDWQGRYQARPQDWRPFGGGPDRSLWNMIAATVAAPGNQPPQAGVVFPSYVEIRTINEPANRGQLMRLRREGCFVIIDHLSVCHPRLFDAYRRSMLDLFPQTVLFKMAPFDPVPILDFEVAVPFKQRFDSFFYERVNLDSDFRSCGWAGSDLSFRAWFSQQLANLGNVQAGVVRPFWHQ